MADYKKFLIQIQQNLNILKEREAKYGGNAPLEVLNQIQDHEEAITLTEQAISGAIGEVEWEESIRPLLISVAPYRAAQSVVVILGQYVSDQGVKLSQERGPEAAATAGKLLTTTLSHLRQSPKGIVIAKEFEQDPTAYQQPVEKQLAQAIVAEPTLADQLKKLLIEYGQATRKQATPTASGHQAALHGSGAIAQGKGAQGVGERGVYVGGNAGLIITGDENKVSAEIIGRDKISGVTGNELTRLFQTIYQQIEARPIDPNVDKKEIIDTVQKIEQEVGQGEVANPNKVERWLTHLYDMAYDIGEVTIACLMNPAAGVATVIQKIGEKVKQEHGRNNG